MALFDEIKESLTSYLNENSSYKPNVDTIYDDTKYPFVCIDIRSNEEIGSTPCGNEAISLYTYQIDIYTMNLETANSQEIAREIEIHVREVMEEMYGFKRVRDEFNYDKDKKEYQLTLQYEVYINEYRNMMY